MPCVENIYQWIYALCKAGGPDYTKQLRQGNSKRRKIRLLRGKRVIIPDRVSIDQRPEIVSEGTRTGNLETLDLVKCTYGYLVTVTDRKTLFNLAAIVSNKEAGTVSEVLKKVLLPIRSVLLQSPPIIEPSL